MIGIGAGSEVGVLHGVIWACAKLIERDRRRYKSKSRLSQVKSRGYREVSGERNCNPRFPLVGRSVLAPEKTRFQLDLLRI